MFNKNIPKRCFLLPLVAAIWFAVFLLPGCSGGGDGGSSGPAYSERDVSFGGVVLYHFADRSITLMNAGSDNLPLDQIEYPALPFTIVDDECSGVTLAPSGTCDLRIRFSPTDQGNHEGFFVVPLSGSDTNFVGVNLDGIGNGLNVTINQVSIAACKTITLIVSITDQFDNYVPGLTWDDFTLVEDLGGDGSGTFVPPESSNLSVVLALDCSPSVADVLPEIKEAAKAFIGDLGEGDEVAVFSFAGDTREEIEFRTVPDSALEGAVDGIDTTRDGTAIYSTISYLCDYIDSDSGASNYRRAIVLFTDGDDQDSVIDIDEAIADALTAGIPVFTIGLGTEDDSYKEALQKLSEDTYGQYYDAPTEAVLSTVYPKIAELLTNPYIIEYISSSDDGETVTVNLAVDKDGMTGEDTREFEGCP